VGAPSLARPRLEAPQPAPRRPAPGCHETPSYVQSNESSVGSEMPILKVEFWIAVGLVVLLASVGAIDAQDANGAKWLLFLGILGVGAWLRKRR
jgi:hypothetical protein